MDLTEKLKPCPFCGGAPRLHAVCGEYWVDCSMGHHGSMYSDLSLALRSWQIRVISTQNNQREQVINETHCKKLNLKPRPAFWDIRLNTRCQSCQEEFDVIEAHPDFLAEQGGARSGVTGVECPACGHEFQIEMEF